MLLQQLLNLNFRQLRLGKWSFIVALTALLLLFDYNEVFIYDYLFEYLKRTTATDYMTDKPVNTFSQALNEFLNGGKILITLSYRLFYCSLSLVIVHVYFNSRTKTGIAIRIYSFILVLCLLLHGLAKVLYSEPLLIVATRVDNIIVSPALIMLIIPAFHLTPQEKDLV